MMAEIFGSNLWYQRTFIEAIVASMDGVIKEDIIINFFFTLKSSASYTCGRRKQLHEDNNESSRKLNVPIVSTKKPTRRPTLSPTPGVEVETGIAVSYNVTIPIDRYNTDDGLALYTLLYRQLINAIDNGNFTTSLQSYAAHFNSFFFLSGSSTSTDYTSKPFACLPLGKNTHAPTTKPSSQPTNKMPTKESKRPSRYKSNRPTPQTRKRYVWRTHSPTKRPTTVR